MILLYRITPFLVAIVALLGYAAFVFRFVHPLVAMSVSFLCIAILMARLLRFHMQEFSFWFFLGIACLFFLSSFGMLFLFETPWVSIVLSLVCTALLVLFTEFVFLYTHLPSRYQPFSLEHLTSLLNLLSIFFFSSFAFATRLLIQVPLTFLALLFFLLSFFLVYGVLWVTKAESFRSRLYALFGAIVLTELFACITYFPTGFYTNAAFMTIFSYAFFGLTRTEALHKLSREVVKRYVFVSVFLLCVVAISSKWL
ncbi:MAG: hypothetical protein NTX72_02270 [Candidatus Uhrbacteria bacterium]|nr:hypothetical protein [Candidatus Uhrbacteria bacterium]